MVWRIFNNGNDALQCSFSVLFYFILSNLPFSNEYYYLYRNYSLVTLAIMAGNKNKTLEIQNKIDNQSNIFHFQAYFETTLVRMMVEGNF